MFVEIAKNDGVTMYGSPSRGWAGRFLNSHRLRAGVRSLNRRRKRRGRSESGNEILPDWGDIRAGVPTIAGCVAFIRGTLGHGAVWVFVADRYSLRTQLVAFLSSYSLKGEARVVLWTLTL